MSKRHQEALVAKIRGFGLETRTTFFCGDVELRLIREAHIEPIRRESDVIPLGLVSRLDAALSRSEVELAEERRTATEVSGWLLGLKARPGNPFPYQAELDEKRARMVEIEGWLAAVPGTAAPMEDAAARPETIGLVERPPAFLRRQSHLFSRRELMLPSAMIRALMTPRFRGRNLLQPNGRAPMTKRVSAVCYGTTHWLTTSNLAASAATPTLRIIPVSPLPPLGREQGRYAPVRNNTPSAVLAFAHDRR